MQKKRQFEKKGQAPSSRRHVTHETFNQNSDAKLIQLIGEKKDSSAFEALFKRHKNSMYNLALSITGSHNKAEDAIQESMLNIWSYAASFLPTGNARGWIMKTVVRAAMKKTAHEKREIKEFSEEIEEKSGTPCTAFTRADNNERLQVLRQCILNLPTTNQKIISLYFTAEMSQTEIAQLLRLSQRTISTRIKEALNSLRTEMITAGFAAAAPTFYAQLIPDAFAAGASHSLQFPEQLINVAGNTYLQQEGPRTPQPTRPYWALAGKMVCLAFISLILILGSQWWNTHPQVAPLSASNQTISSSPAIKPEQATSNSSTPPNFTHEWDFNDGRKNPEDLKIIMGTCRILNQGGQNNSGCLSVESNNAKILLDIPIIKAGPLLVSYRQKLGSVAPPKNGYVAIVRWEKWTPPAIDFLNVGTIKQIDPGAWVDTRTYLHNGICDVWIGGKRRMLSCERPTKNARLVMTFRGRQLIDNIRIQQIAPDDVPNVQKYLKALAQLHPNNRSGIVELPGLKGANPNKPVSVQFWSDTNCKCFGPLEKTP